ncbi:MAG: hypothetical protein UW24_C0014G0018 [Parcubacteria group bacterium GW2011_GWA2_44_12]|nr:MAG: hypothetical protein UW24_C0014G0018 [Parcubacteria group bacterium GW2011_GWA2_44_12]
MAKESKKIGGMISRLNIKALLLFKAHIIGPTSVALILIIGYAFFIKPRIDFLTNKTEDTDVTHWEEELRSKEAEKNKLAQEVQRFDSLRELNLAVLDRVLPKDFDEISFLSEVEDMVHSAGLTLEDISFTFGQGGIVGFGSRATTLPPSIKRVTVTIRVAGLNGYSGLKTFLRRIENNIHVFDVMSFPLVTDSDAADTPALLNAEGQSKSYEFTLQTYFLTN